MEIGLLGFGVNIEKKWDVGYFIRGGREKGYVVVLQSGIF
jgi:hypothetical protein